MIKSIRHTGIVVDDLETSLRFYRDLFGFTIIREAEECGDYIDAILALERVKVKTVKLTSPDGQLIELLKYDYPAAVRSQRKINDIGIGHIAFQVDDLDREYHRLGMIGVLFNSPPRISPDGVAKVTFCRAPEGTFIELVEIL